jgi:hypothetical protein
VRWCRGRWNILEDDQEKASRRDAEQRDAGQDVDLIVVQFRSSAWPAALHARHLVSAVVRISNQSRGPPSFTVSLAGVKTGLHDNGSHEMISDIQHY